MFTAYRYSVGFIVPIVLCAIGVLGKKVARGPGWQWEDFSVGAELTLTGVSGALVNLFEFLKPDRVTFGLVEKRLLAGNLAVAIWGLLFYYLTLSLRQDFGPASGKPLKKQLWVILGLSNVIGLGILIGALLLMAP